MKLSSIKKTVADGAGITGQTLIYDSAVSTGSNTFLPVGLYGDSIEGTYAFTTNQDKLYLHTGQGWFNVAIVNTNPTFTTSPSGKYDLATDATAYQNGTATTITLAATDPEGMPITWGYSANTAMNNIAHISNDSSIYTIKPKTQDSAGSPTPDDGTLTFTASDGINIASASSTFTLTFDATIANSESTTLLTKAVGDAGINSTIVDNNGTGNSRTINNVGSSQQGTFSPYSPSGYSWYFAGPGANNGVSTTDLSIGSSEQFTIEAWINHECITSGALFNFATNTTTLTFMLYLGLTSGTSVGLKLHAGSELINASSETIERDKWYHIAITRQSDNNLRLYVDGTLKGTSSSTYTAALGAATWFGKWYNDNTYNYKGYVNDWRVVKGKAVYTGNFTPPNGKLTKTGGTYPSNTNITNPTGSETKLLLCNNPMFKDIETGLTITDINSNTEIEPYTPYKVNAPYSAGTHGGSIQAYVDAGLRISDHNDFALTNQNFTIEWWMYVNEFGGSANVITGHGWASSGDYCPWTFNFYTGGGGTQKTLQIYASSSGRDGTAGSGWDIYSAFSPTGISYVMTEKKWYHCAYVRNGNNLYFYVNGVQVATASYSGTIVDDEDGDISIGVSADGGEGSSDIVFADYRMVVGTAVYTGAFTPPSGPLTTTGGTYPSNTNVNTSITAAHTKLLFKGVDGKIIDEGGRHNLKVAGNVQSDTGLQKYSVPSILFDGTGDFLSIPYSGLYAPGNGNYTAECWMYTSTDNQNQPLLMGMWNGSGAYSWALQLGASTNMYPRFLFWDGSSYNDNPATTKVNISAWNHIAVVRNSDTFTLFLNGVSVKYAKITGTAATVDTPLTIGATSSGGQTFTGNISDARFTKSSRYPFIPLKETLTTTSSALSGITLTASNTELLCAHVNGFTDGSSNEYTLTGAGNVAASTFAPAAGMYSWKIDGVNGDKVTSTGALLSIGSSSSDTFTIECWLYLTTAGSETQAIFARASGSGEGSNVFALDFDQNGNIKLMLGGSYTGATGHLQAIYNGHLKVGRWQHVALVRAAANDTKVFVDGTAIIKDGGNSDGSGTTTHTTQWSVPAGTTAYIGASHYNPPSPRSKTLNGYISNFRIVKGQAIYTQNFTPPTAALKG